MFHILGFIIIIIFIVLIIGISIIGTIIRALFGGKRQSSTSSGNTSSYTSWGRQQRQQEHILKEEGQPKHKKIFSKEEGEYVDFEEIKD